MPLAIRSDHARGEVEQRQRRIAFLLAAELITHAELGAELGRDFGGLLDVLLATGQYPFAGLEILVAAFESVFRLHSAPLTVVSTRIHGPFEHRASCSCVAVWGISSPRIPPESSAP